jgi:hypothetical protein
MSWLLLSIVVMRFAEWSRGMRCLIGYCGSCSIGVVDTLGELRRGWGVVTLGDGAVGSLASRALGWRGSRLFDWSRGLWFDDVGR